MLLSPQCGSVSDVNKGTLKVADHVANKKLHTFDVAESASGASVNGTVTLVRLGLGASSSASQDQIYQPEYR